jgi:tRNA(Ile)-lysidine synthase
MEGRPVRGGGRASGDGIALDVTRFAALPAALARRLLRHAARALGSSLDFRATESLRELASGGHAGQKLELAEGLRAERTPRELRLTISALAQAADATPLIPEYIGAIPCEILGHAFGIQLLVDLETRGAEGQSRDFRGLQVRLRNWKAGDRVRLRHSGSPRKVKEVLERLRITGTNRAIWPVLEFDRHIVWMKGVEVEPQPGISVTASELPESHLTVAASHHGDDTFE